MLVYSETGSEGIIHAPLLPIVFSSSDASRRNVLILLKPGCKKYFIAGIWIDCTRGCKDDLDKDMGGWCSQPITVASCIRLRKERVHLENLRWAD